MLVSGHYPSFSLAHIREGNDVRLCMWHFKEILSSGLYQSCEEICFVTALKKKPNTHTILYKGISYMYDIYRAEEQDKKKSELKSLISLLEKGGWWAN